MVGTAPQLLPVRPGRQSRSEIQHARKRQIGLSGRFAHPAAAPKGRAAATRRARLAGERGGPATGYHGIGRHQRPAQGPAATGPKPDRGDRQGRRRGRRRRNAAPICAGLGRGRHPGLNDLTQGRCHSGHATHARLVSGDSPHRAVLAHPCLHQWAALSMAPAAGSGQRSTRFCRLCTERRRERLRSLWPASALAESATNRRHRLLR